VIFCRTPYRVSFFGGGTDYPAWYRERGGAVLSTTINKYSYITCRYLPPFFEYQYRIRYYHREETQTIDEIQHPSVRECLRFLEIKRGVDIVHHGDLPAQSGLGSSSTFTVGLLHALYTLKHQMPTKRELDLRIVAGPAIFGVGWGLAGFCPGPALTALGFGSRAAFIFVAAMLTGMWLARFLSQLPSLSRVATQVDPLET